MMEIDFNEIENNGGPSECICDGVGHCPIYQQYIHKGVQHQCKISQSSRNHWWRTFRPDYSEEGRKRYEDNKELDASKNKVEKAIQELKNEGIFPDSIDSDKRKGLGTVITNILSKVGITKEVVAKAAGIEDCSCNKREEWLNKIFTKGDISE